MEKSRKNQEETTKKIFKKKSSACINSTLQTKVDQPLPWKGKEYLEETKDSFGNRNSMKSKGKSVKKERKYTIEKMASVNHLQYLRVSNFNDRCLTETYGSKSVNPNCLDKKINTKFAFISPDRKTINKDALRNSKERLSLNECKKHKDTSTGKLNLLKKKESSSSGSIEKMREDIHKDIRKSLSKQILQKKDLLKITQKYERLIERMTLTEVQNNCDINEFDTQHFAAPFTSNFSSQSSLATVRQVKQNVEKTTQLQKAKACPGLQLDNLRKLKINDYQDEFMSHYDELSESWKRDLAIQRRY